MPKRASEIWRDYITDGVPTSGAHEPIKADIRELLELFNMQLYALESYGGGTGASGATNSTAFAALYAAAPAGSLVWLNGVYELASAPPTIEKRLTFHSPSLSHGGFRFDYDGAAGLYFLGRDTNGSGIYNCSFTVDTGRHVTDVIKVGAAPHDSIATATITMTIASPAVVTWTSHGLAAGSSIKFTTTGALPTGVTAGTTYYVIATGLTANTFQFSATPSGSAVNTSGTQSGTHTGHKLTPDVCSYFMMENSNITFLGTYTHAFKADGIPNDYFGGSGVRALRLRNCEIFGAPGFDETVEFANVVGGHVSSTDVFGSIKVTGGGHSANNTFRLFLSDSVFANTVTINNTASVYFSNCECTTLDVGTGIVGGWFDSPPAFDQVTNLSPLTFLVPSMGHLIAKDKAITAGGHVEQSIRATTSRIGMFFGSGAPTISAAKGSIYLRTDGTTTNNRAYINTDGGTTWTAITTVA